MSEDPSKALEGGSKISLYSCTINKILVKKIRLTSQTVARTWLDSKYIIFNNYRIYPLGASVFFPMPVEDLSCCLARLS